MRLSSSIQISPSATLAMNALALEKKQKGERVFNLSVGEPMISTSEIIIEAAYRAMKEGKTHYSPVAGIPELRSAASRWMNENYQTQFYTHNTIITCGGKHGLALTLQALLEPGDEVIIIAPYWVSYRAMVQLAGGAPKIIETSPEHGWKVSPEKIAAACTAKTRALILNNAANPTGVLYTRDELSALMRVAHERGLTIVSDEVYSGLVYDGKEYVSCASFGEFRESTVVVQSCSKNFAMTGWRVGFVFGPEPLIERLEILQSQTTTGTSSISQWAAVAAFAYAHEIIPKMRLEMQTRRDVLCQALEAGGRLQVTRPDSGLYLFVPLSIFGTQEINDAAWCRQMLEAANVAMVPGSAFGAPGFVRLSFGGGEEEITAAVQKCLSG